ncbi:MAG: oligoribonuclease [Acidimicrobiales bacterium]
MLVWMDLEMTGLDPGRHVIVEMATLVTDDQLAVVAEGPDLVVSAPEDALAAMEDKVRSMHTKSGLLAAIQASPVTLEEAGAVTLAFIKQHVPKPRKAPLCGNSIGTDRRFLAAYLPELDAHLHYRSIDVSSIKELCRRWYPDAYKRAPRKASGHRALDDIRESLAELAYYRQAIFRAGEPTDPADPPDPAQPAEPVEPADPGVPAGAPARGH